MLKSLLGRITEKEERAAQAELNSLLQSTDAAIASAERLGESIRAMRQELDHANASESILAAE